MKYIFPIVFLIGIFINSSAFPYFPESDSTKVLDTIAKEKIIISPSQSNLPDANSVIDVSDNQTILAMLDSLVTMTFFTDTVLQQTLQR
jgi:hypothetical protein